MVDIVANHFGSTQSQTGQWSSYRPFNSQSYFHNYCTISQSQYNSHDQTAIEGCWITDTMPDVDTTQSAVKSAYQTWVQQLVSNYSSTSLEYPIFASLRSSVKLLTGSLFPTFQSMVFASTP